MSASEIVSRDPFTNEIVVALPGASADDVTRACARARAVAGDWAETSQDARRAVVRAFAALVATRRHDVAVLIARETGKPLWEALTEADAVAAKAEISIRAQDERAGERVETAAGATARVSHRPHGVLAVIGPFNFPMHLANGHILPALLAGNAVVFKPSEKTPACGLMMAALWREAGLPEDVLSVVVGDGAVGRALVQDPQIDGVLFTGGLAAGTAIHRALAGTPQKILALELGGNAPLVVWDVEDAEAAAHLIVQSSFITAGQRCTCARRLILPIDRRGDTVLEALVAVTDQLIIGGPFETPEPFMGPVIDAAAGTAVLTAQDAMLASGGRALRAARLVGDHPTFLRPGLVETAIDGAPDEEVFGPLLRIGRVDSFETALLAANATRFGLAAGLISDEEALYRRFRREIRAGIVNWNRPTTGASSAAPFGGIGLSGNHRPSAYYAADYCAYPVAGLESPNAAFRISLGLAA